MAGKTIGILALAACAAALLAQQAAGPAQPIPYSHKTHIANGLTCKDCHTMPDPGEAATFPATTKCMTCHTSIKTDSPAIKKLAEYHAKKEEIPWVRVYQLPDFVGFNHKQHLDSGKATCENCHGSVKDMDVMRREKPLTMSNCMSCHASVGANQACNSCHEPQ